MTFHSSLHSQRVAPICQLVPLLLRSSAVTQVTNTWRSSIFAVFSSFPFTPGYLLGDLGQQPRVHCSRFDDHTPGIQLRASVMRFAGLCINIFSLCISSSFPSPSWGTKIASPMTAGLCGGFIGTHATRHSHSSRQLQHGQRWRRFPENYSRWYRVALEGPVAVPFISWALCTYSGV